MQFFPAPRDAGTANQNTEKVAENLSCRVHPQFPSGSQHRRAQNFEWAKFPQGQTKINFLADEVALIKPAARIEVAARCEKERASPKVEPEIDSAKRGHENSRP
jgi:hypothetical protein